ncbi:hypothetical protein E3Q22_01444 [Wallemia mellicola]|uniref:Ribosomal protein L17 n=1 Tax=Wallemia mellicola TaxID=1708541 RepID=A0A4V4MR87_9BASI|nr:hypothetical protein E3Q22_01444 [Wallemia mellicola]TIC16091.1 hypothetical protein E3Q14_00164 [Wallemia mellicola]TIC16981.1 hypothetical protein E3Q13_02731 [Wallemia mellicola]TIC17333.1 hypothetical protein E3Q15_00708 [Wallemia mellicola]TIC57286.1 hypothetical protein E3Q05_01248 [Wallemia mellicola]
MVKQHLHYNKQNKQMLMRNLVSQLFHNEQITTTLPKAKEAQKFADRLITKGKNNTSKSDSLANSFLIDPFNKLKNQLVDRYKDRQGGYTRLHLLGNRQGDNAPRAVLELVDNPRDIKREVLMRTIARESLLRKTSWSPEKSNILRQLTQINLSKSLRYLSQEEKDTFHQNVLDIQDRILAESQLGLRRFDSDRKPQSNTLTWPSKGKTVYAGERTSGMAKSEGSPISLSKGVFRKSRKGPSNKLV